MPLLIAFIIIPLLEIAVFIEVGDEIGLGWTLLCILLTAIIGVGLIRAQGIATMKRAQQLMAEGKPPVQEALTAVCLVIAGILLLTPGFVTDTFGFLLLFPPFRALLGAGWVSRMQDRAQPQGFGEDAGGFDQPRVTVIEGEFEEVVVEPEDTSDDRPAPETKEPETKENGTHG